MKFNLALSETLIEKLTRRNEGDSGYVYIVESEDLMTALALTIPYRDPDDLCDTDLALPFGLVPWGSFHCTANVNNVESECDLRLFTHPQEKKIRAFYREKLKYEELPYCILTDAEIAANYFLVRVQAIIPVSFEVCEAGIRDMIERLRCKIDETVSLPELRGHPYLEPYSFPTKQFCRLEDMDILECHLQLKIPNGPTDDEPMRAVLIDIVKRSITCCAMSIKLDAISLVPRSETLKSIEETYAEVSLRRALTMIENCLLDQLKEPGTMSPPETFHFLLEGAGHFITITRAKNNLDKDIGYLRDEYQAAYDLPADFQFVWSNSFQFPSKRLSHIEPENLNESDMVNRTEEGKPA